MNHKHTSNIVARRDHFEPHGLSRSRITARQSRLRIPKLRTPISGFKDGCQRETTNELAPKRPYCSIEFEADLDGTQG